VNIIKRFWNWYEDKVITALIPSTIILWLQIPHTYTAADCWFDLGLGAIHADPILDFFLYGIDLLEAIPILGNTMALYVEIRRRRRKKHV